MSVHPNVPKIVKRLHQKLRLWRIRGGVGTFKRENAGSYSGVAVTWHTTLTICGLINFDIDEQRQLIVELYRTSTQYTSHRWWLDGPLRKWEASSMILVWRSQFSLAVALQVL